MQTTTQPGNCSHPPGTYRSGAIFLGFKYMYLSTYACGYAGLVPFWRLASHQRPRLAFQKVPPLTDGIYREAGLFQSILHRYLVHQNE